MKYAAEMVALVAPWLASPADRRMSRITLVVIVVVIALGLGSAGWLVIEATDLAVQRLYREDSP